MNVDQSRRPPGGLRQVVFLVCQLIRDQGSKRQSSFSNERPPTLPIYDAIDHGNSRQ